MLTHNSSITTIENIPCCEICKLSELEKEAIIDCKTRSGPWAYVCLNHYQMYGIGIGLGLGQLLILKDKNNGTDN